MFSAPSKKKLPPALVPNSVSMPTSLRCGARSPWTVRVIYCVADHLEDCRRRRCRRVVVACERGECLFLACGWIRETTTTCPQTKRGHTASERVCVYKYEIVVAIVEIGVAGRVDDFQLLPGVSMMRFPLIFGRLN